MLWNGMERGWASSFPCGSREPRYLTYEAEGFAPHLRLRVKRRFHLPMAMTMVDSEKVLELGLPRPQGWLYFVTGDGSVCRVQDGQRELVSQEKVQREPGYNYFVDTDGDVARKPWGT